MLTFKLKSNFGMRCQFLCDVCAYSLYRCVWGGITMRLYSVYGVAILIM